MKFFINADTYGLVSNITAEDIELLKKVNPEALKIKDEKGNEKFAIGYTEGKPSISDFGVSFGGQTRDESHKLTISGVLPTTAKNADEAKDWLAEKFGRVLSYLRDFEASVPAEAARIRSEKKAIVDSIDVR